MSNILDHISELPEGWIQTTLATVAAWGSGGTPSRKREDYFKGDIPWIKTGELGKKIIRDAEEKITKEAVENSSAKIFPKGSVAIAMYGATIGKTSILGIDASSNQACAIAQPIKEVLFNDYLYYYLLSQTRKFIDLGKGGAQPNISQTILKNYPIFLPSLAEQQRIVDKIEELFSDLDSGINSLKTAQQQLKVYRQAVLKWAFEGKLTAQWREEQQRQGKLESADTLLAQIKAEREQRYQKELEVWQAEVEAWEANGKEGKKPRKPKKFNEPKLAVEDLEELPDLPKGWQWVFPENICSPEDYSLAIGPFGSNLKVKDYRDSGKPLVFVRHITSGDFDLNPKYVSEEKFKQLKPHAIQPLDLLITKMGDPPGDCEIYPIGRKNAIITADCLKFRVWSDHVNRKFYKYCINSNLIKKQLGLITQGVAQKKISLERFKSLRFPLPTTTEQERIVEEIESRLSICDQLEADIEANLKKAEALRQSILKQAFEGKLVPQDPNDEPASVLLERIRAEREVEKGKDKGRAKTRKVDN
jgi:type I restriction enzyme S subunit